MNPTYLQKYTGIGAKSLAFVLLAFLFGISLDCFSQGKQANTWYFGWGAGVDFNQGSPPGALSDGMVFTGEGNGSGCISDSTGNLLFYSDGVTIWNRQHQVMQNGQFIGSNSTQGALIIPNPGDVNLYYLFNIDWDPNAGENNFQYSMIDMTLDNGLGGVVEGQKEIELLSNVNWQLSAVKNVSNNSIWVLTHDHDNDYFYAFLITNDSLHSEPVVSQAGSVFDSRGYMKISPDGSKVAAAVHVGNSLFEVFEFDVNSGTVSDENLIHKSDAGAFAVEFSPDNTKLYVSSGFIYQYDLLAGNPQQILDSEFEVTDLISNPTALQVGPDGKLYAASSYHDFLSVIHYPNELGDACNFEYNNVYL